MTALLDLDNVSRRSAASTPSMASASSVEKGEIVGLIGPNGAGKTTLINLITGVHPATAGRVRFEDRTSRGCAPYQIARLGHRAHIPDRAAVPQDDGDGECRRRRAVLRARRQRARGAGHRPRASGIHRACRHGRRPAASLTWRGASGSNLPRASPCGRGC